MYGGILNLYYMSRGKRHMSPDLLLVSRRAENVNSMRVHNYVIDIMP